MISGSWFRASAIITVNKIQQHAGRIEAPDDGHKSARNM
jgi:hypothetical protein